MRAHATLALLLLLLCGAAACAKESYPADLWNSKFADAGGGSCRPTQSTSYPARLAAMSTGSSLGSGSVIEVDTLFEGFKEVCGNCHGPGIVGLGNFSITSAIAFQMSFGSKELAHVLSNEPTDPMDANDPNDPMPPYPPGSPNGMPFSKRTPDDPIYQFATLAQKWIALGKPASFTLGGSDAGAGHDGGDGGGGGTSSSKYLMSASIGNAMTNIGNCIPSADMVNATSPSAEDARLDAMFASLQPAAPGVGVTAAQIIGLPEHLSQTDLTTFDAEELAKHRVFAFAPGYPLWSENAGKIRFVRVPIGTSIEYDKANDTFKIPPNTRFYKTFMKQIADTDGSLRWRKIETRLIVARPDRPGVTGDAAPTALFGTYRWHDDESEADLVETPLRNGEPFADTVIQYNTDEQLASDILSSSPAAPEQALIDNHAARHYAIPGAARCHDCHMGSATQSFVLGFLPVQIKRRTDGGGGTYEPTGPDEATQLQRFIDYGLITGIASQDEVPPLEQMEGSRTPRNEHELAAQGYLLGNCSHCHNPRGRPTIDSPALRCLLNFLPGPDSGIFQFPLERYSPRIFRGPTGATRIPYITPSLMDYPRYDPNHITDLVPGEFGTGGFGDNNVVFGNLIYAPWRALVYRNVDNGFAYVDDEALFPHMPMHTAGYDPRAKQILSDWMVSIPAALKHPEFNEYEVVTGANSLLFALTVPGAIDLSEQPYVEVLPGAPGYPAAVQAAATRLQVLHTGYNSVLPTPSQLVTFSRYADPLDTADIMDPASLRDPVCNPVPLGTVETAEGLHLPPPDHPHWVVTDLTSPPGAYTPRRPDWQTVLITNKGDTTPTAQSCGNSASSQQSAQQDENNAIDLVQTVHLGIDPESTSDPCAATTSGDAAFACFAKTPIPFGLWQQKPGCTFPPSVHPVSSYSGDRRPRWMDRVPNLSPDAPVYEETPGASVFKMICINCHGPLADSTGRLAKNLAIMTGGNARVADFRDGFMGPVGSTLTTSDRDLIFGDAALPKGASSDWVHSTTDDRAARYMSWMALGGTKAIIPTEILQIVSLTQVLGERRPYLNAGALSANMLSTAKALCQTFFGALPGDPSQQAEFDLTTGVYGFVDRIPALINRNGDAQTWFQICARNHTSPVHVIAGRVDSNKVSLYVPRANDGMAFATDSSTLIDPASYPAGKPVGNAAGGTDSSGLTPDNLWPWCINPQLDAQFADPVEAYAKANNLPLCPSGVSFWGTKDAERWAVRGAINAGISVFLYVHDLEAKGEPDPDYNQCELLGGSGGVSGSTSCGP
jgi:mono/diheme cytochrome c family protein